MHLSMLDSSTIIDTMLEVDGLTVAEPYQFVWKDRIRTRSTPVQSLALLDASRCVPTDPSVVPRWRWRP